MVEVVPPLTQMIGLAAITFTLGLSTVIITVLVAIQPLASVVVIV